MGNTNEPCLYVKRGYSRTCFEKSAGGSTKYNNESDSREMTFYGGRYQYMHKVKHYAEYGEFRADCQRVGHLHLSKSRSVYYKRIGETNCFFALDTMM